MLESLVESKLFDVNERQAKVVGKLQILNTTVIITYTFIAESSAI